MVEKPDVIGALFGQTEGLLGPELDLRELQRTGRVGRIDVFLSSSNGKTRGKIIIPTSLDLTETALIAASTETIEKIGPCHARLRVTRIKDVRSAKREYIMKRAKALMRKFLNNEIPEASWLTEKLKESVRIAELSDYYGLPSGPDIEEYDEIILVEGRADVINLLKHGIKNVIAVGGTSIPKPVVELTKRKTTTVFVDGDRGGELIVKELMQVADIDYVAKSPEGKEVEELTQKEIYKALREKIPLDQYKEEMKIKDIDADTLKKAKEALDEIVGTRAVYVFNSNLDLIEKFPKNQIDKYSNRLKDAKLVVVDGSLDQEMVSLLDRMNVKYVACETMEEGVDGIVKILTRDFIESYLG